LFHAPPGWHGGCYVLGMHALLGFALAISICAGCSTAAADDKKTETAPLSASPTNLREAALSPATPAEGLAGAAPDAAPPAALSNEELERLLDALEQEIGSPR
jgi:hypothetical protein